MPSPTLDNALLKRGVRALRTDQAGGVTLTAAAVVALVWANWPGGSSYVETWTRIAPWSHALGFGLSIRDWVDQGLFFVFFAQVGLEIRREVTVGELGSVRRAAVPVVAALVGMAVPALVYTAVLAGGVGSSAWGIPTATDVAFAVGALGLVGGRSGRARVFLMTLAVADDIASILVLVVFYSRGLHPEWLPVGIGALIVLVPLWWSRVPAGVVRIALVAVAWWAMLHAGVDAAVIGVALGLWGPDRRPAGPTTARRPGRTGVRGWVLRITPLVNGLVLPLFALANIGIAVSTSMLSGPGALAIFLAVLAARLVGKPVGIVAGTLGTRRWLRSSGPPVISRRYLTGVGAVAGVGFTVPLLIIRQALPAGPLTVAATAGLLVGSVIAVGTGAVLLRAGPAATRRPVVTGAETT
jgi:NhaA family Na+:H+ antiporter